MVQVEAMLCGRPVVSTDLPTGVPWVNRDGESGLVVPPGDPEALAAALLVDGQDPRCAPAGCRARDAPREYFGAERMCRSFDGLCRWVAVGGRGAGPDPPRRSIWAKRALDVRSFGDRARVSSPLWALSRLRSSWRTAVRCSSARSAPAGGRVSGLEVPLDDSRRRGATGAVQADRARSARHAHRTHHARNRDGRTAAVVEHLRRRHELRRAARASSR